MKDLSHLKAGEIVIYKGENGVLLPADAESEERVKKLKPFQFYSFVIKGFRNYMFHRKFFKMLKTAFDNQNNFESEDWFRHHAMLGIGHCDVKIDANGKTMYEIKSISFAKCTQSEFELIYEKTLTFIIKEYGFTEEFTNHLLTYA